MIDKHTTTSPLAGKPEKEKTLEAAILNMTCSREEI
jgi:hypothetical protein